jgi:TM2 domain-containing membrane protein YozV
MKKALLAPLCSALVIPGLGQVINQHIKKGVILLALDFVFIIAFTIEMYQILRGVIGPGVLNSDEPEMIMERIMAGDYTSLVFLFAAFGVLWIYSIVDAFLGGRKADELEESHAKLHDR